MTLNNILNFKKDQIIFKENDPIDGLYIIESGRVVLLKQSSKARIVPMAELAEKDFLGVEQLLGPKKRDCSAICLEDTSLLKIKSEDLDKYFKMAPDWQRKLYETISTRLVKSRELISDNRIMSEKLWTQGEFSPEIETMYKNILNL